MGTLDDRDGRTIADVALIRREDGPKRNTHESMPHHVAIGARTRQISQDQVLVPPDRAWRDKLA